MKYGLYKITDTGATTALPWQLERIAIPQANKVFATATAARAWAKAKGGKVIRWANCDR